MEFQIDSITVNISKFCEHGIRCGCSDCWVIVMRMTNGPVWLVSPLCFLLHAYKTLQSSVVYREHLHDDVLEKIAETRTWAVETMTRLSEKFGGGPGECDMFG